MLTSDYTTQKRLPTMEELPYQDDKPVDSELQDLIAHLLKDILALIWANRNDWFFGIDVGWYYEQEPRAIAERPRKLIAPDGFLCLGVPRIREPNLRLSYVTWEENGVVPTLALEVVSKTPGGEYKKKKRIYAERGVLYYIIYAPLRKRKRRLTVLRLNGGGEYESIDNNPVWMPEIGLGIGTAVGTYQGITREWLYWYDKAGNRYLTSDEAREQERQARVRAEFQREQERQAREQAEQRAEELARRLRSLGIDPDELNP